jgi:TonB family protein
MRPGAARLTVLIAALTVSSCGVAPQKAPVSAPPVTSHYKKVEIPELGIHMSGLPDGVTLPLVMRRFDGYQANLRIGAATLTLARLEDPVPAVSDVRDAAYRAIQQVTLDEDLGPKAHGETTAINGHAAWTTVSARRTDNGTGVYTCVTYVVVDQHLYRFVADAMGGDTRPPDFEAAVRAMSELTFGAIDRSAVHDEVAPAGLLIMPKFHPDFNVDWYPPEAKRRGEEGIVGLEFSIDGKGHVQDVQRSYGEAGDLATSAQTMLQRAAFRVGPGWEARDYEKLRFAMEFQFSIDEPSQGRHCHGSSTPRVIPGAEVVAICGSIRR